MAEKRATAAAGVIFRHQTHANIFQWPRLHCKKSLILFMAFTRTVWWETEYYNYVHCFFPHKIIVAEEFHDYSRLKHFFVCFSGPPTFSKCADNSSHCQPALTATSGSAQTNPVQNDGQSLNQQELLHQVIKRNIAKVIILHTVEYHVLGQCNRRWADVFSYSTSPSLP